MITFILGVSATVMVGMLIWLTVNVIKTLKGVKLLQEENQIQWRDIEERYNSIERDRHELQRLTDQRIDTTISYVDSRFDKFNNYIERNYVSNIDKTNNTISYNN